MLAEFGKWPHEFGDCSEEEQEYLKAWWNEKVKRETPPKKKGIR